jgi:hypothetical protein
MKAASLFLALGLLGGCASVAMPSGTNGAVKLGQVADLGGPRVRPDRVLEDSRCPAGVQCVWAGRVVLRASLLEGSSSRQVDLTLGTPVPIAGGTLSLIAVEPGRTADGQPREHQLRFTFAFESAR